MRWVRYEAGNGARYGILNGERVADVDGDPFDGFEKTGKEFGPGDVRLLPPVIPRNFYAVGYNYAAHTKEAAGFVKSPPKPPAKPDVGSRFPSAIIGNNENVVIPKTSAGIVQFEGELVAVIGKSGKNLSETDVLSHVLGYTIGNDISERAWQKEDMTIWRAKSADTFCPMGPWIETDVDLNTLTTIIRLNGEEVSRFATNSMIFDVARYLSAISRYLTLHPGDVIWMGAEAPSLDMKAGDVVEVEIDQIGTLRNPIVADHEAVGLPEWSTSTKPLEG